MNQLKISLLERRFWALISAIAHKDLSRKSRVKKHCGILGFSFHFEDKRLNKWDAGVHLQYGTIKFMHAGDFFRILTLTNELKQQNDEGGENATRKNELSICQTLSRLFSLGQFVKCTGEM